MHHSFWLTCLGGTIALTGCDRGPIDWREPAPLAADIARAPGLAMDASGRLVARDAAPYTAPVFPGQCPESVRVARDTVGPWYAAWWALRADSTADIVVSHSADGKSWDAPTRVDSLDAGAVGCRRPAPSIYVDGENIHVAYAMAAREGPGIFASHSMDRGMTFHSPVPIVYGDRPGLASIAAQGNTVAVAYEDPNTNPRRIGLALSRTLGHIFEDRAMVSPPTGSARDPRVVIGNRVLAVTWAVNGDSVPVQRMGRYGSLR